MRYELKHDKLAAQIYNLASTEAKARRKAENIYHLYDEIGDNRLFTQEELEYLAQFQPILRPKEHLLTLIEKSKEELGRARRETEARERARLEREKELVKKIKGRQQRISWVIGTAGVIAVALLAFAWVQNRRATNSQQAADEIRHNLEQKSMLIEELKGEFSDIIRSKGQNEPFEAIAYVAELNEKLSSILIDVRDGHLYETVELNGQAWMAENLNYNIGEGSWLYNNDPENGEQYGRLYTWEAAKKACPQGWRLPSNAEFRKMAYKFGGINQDAKDEGSAAFEALIKGGKSNFNAIPGGNRRSSGAFDDLEVNGDYWSSTDIGTDPDKAWLFRFNTASQKLQLFDYFKSFGVSCRCVKE